MILIIKEMPYKNPEKRKENDAKRYLENKEEIKARNTKWREENEEEQSAKQNAYVTNIIYLAISMLGTGVVCDKQMWHKFCQRKRFNAKQKNKPFSDDFDDDIFFEKMKGGCVYCGDQAYTIDRLDSDLGHTPSNCVGCCWPCNFSKGDGDPKLYVRKAYYRVHGGYFDEIEDIWSDNKTMPRFDKAKLRSQKQQRPFTLTREQWGGLIIGKCAYCNRSKPDNRWFGVDRVNPDDGYTLENTVSCCRCCNVDKMKFSAEDTKIRNERIANRLKKRSDCKFMPGGSHAFRSP